MSKTKGDKTKSDIVEMACQLFVKQGFHATTTRQITDGLGLSRGSIYNHFTSKDEIFEVGLEKYHPWLHIPPAVRASEGENIEELFHDAARRMLISWEKHPERIRLHLIELIEFQGKHLPDLFKEIFTEMTEVLRELKQGRKEFESFSIATLSRALLGLFFAYLITDQFRGIPSISGTLESTFDYFSDIYLTGLFTKGIENDT